MTPQQEAHLENIKEWFIHEVDNKYRKGVKEHGGNLWEKAQIIDMALEEVLDLAVYLVTLKAQIGNLQDKFTDYDKEKT